MAAVADRASAVPVAQLIDELAKWSHDDDVAPIPREFVGSLLPESDRERPDDIGGARKSAGAAAARELVRRGSDVLPELLRHVDDRRQTRLTIGPVGPVGSFSLINWYKPRFAFDRKKHPPGISPDEMTSTSSPCGERAYTITVCDACYLVVGQIVNRDLRIIHHRLTQAVVLTSPTRTPALAAAIRADWSDITAREHCQSLIRDSWQSDNPGGAVDRLMFYYPDEGEVTALELLGRPLYYQSPAEDLVSTLLLYAKDLDESRFLLDQFRERYGAAMDADIQWQLYGINSRPPQPRESDKHVAHRDRASRILAEFHPTFDAGSAALPTAATYRGQAAVVSALSGRRASEKLDAAVYRVFLETTKAAFENEFVRQDFDLLAIACISRIAGGEYDAALRDFVDKRIATIEQLPRSIAEQTCLSAFQTWQGRLRNKQR